MKSRTFSFIAALALAGCSGFRSLESDDPGVTEAEVLAAGKATDPALLPHLHHIVTNAANYDTAVLVAAVVALGERRDAGAVPALTTLTSDSREEVRWQVARTLAAIGTPEARTTLAALATNDASEFVRDEAKSLLAH